MDSQKRKLVKYIQPYGKTSNKERMKDSRLEIRIESGLKKHLTERAEQMNVSRNQLLEDIIFHYLYVVHSDNDA